MMTELGVVKRDRGAMPVAVIVGLVAICLYEAVSLVSSVMSGNNATVMYSAPIAALIIIGVLRGHALAHQWGTIMPILALIGVLVGGLEGALALSGGARVVALAFVAACAGFLLLIPLSFSLKASRRFFGLECPKCQSLNVKAADFFYTKRRCRACETTWLE
jgi:hypothetical protein